MSVMGAVQGSIDVRRDLMTGLALHVLLCCDHPQCQMQGSRGGKFKAKMVTKREQQWLDGDDVWHAGRAKGRGKKHKQKQGKGQPKQGRKQQGGGKQQRQGGKLGQRSGGVHKQGGGGAHRT